MKHIRIHISPYIIIPVIFAGIAAISAILAFRITQGWMKQEYVSAFGITIWVVVLAAGAFACGLLIVRVILRPVEVFVRKAEEFPVLAATGPMRNEGEGGDRLAHFARVLEQVSDILGKVEARELFPEIIGQSKAVRAVLSQIVKVAPTDSTVLISGESGTGKELVATSIHEHSARKDKAMVKLNCVAIPEGLLESELFGHERGAFTGATARKIGKFEMADGGTLFLDEIGDMPLNTQGKILRVLQEREFERVGGTKPIKVDVRFVVATNKDLEKMVKAGQFREDLFYRLNVFSVHLPPLRERKEDIPLLVDHIIENGPKSVRVSPVAIQRLMAYPWPGNVRELQNMVERAAVMCENDTIEPHNLPEGIAGGLIHQADPLLMESLSMDEQLREIEKGMILEALQRTAGVQVKAAEFLGINVRSLWHRVKKHNIDVKAIRD